MTTTTARCLFGKCAIVTGSTSGIGLGIAAALAAEGCNAGGRCCFGDLPTQTGRSAFVKSFGRRQASESPRRTNPRAPGRAMGI
jgi:NAD(P)-dependent dehydrogenase (short-subunit alcohol dehydrogenase family)